MICCWKGALVPPDGFISTARSFHASAVPRFQEKAVTVFAPSGPFLLDAPEFEVPATMFHCVVVDAPFVKPAPFPSPTTSMTQAFAFAFVMLTAAGEVAPFALSFFAVVGMGVVWSTPVNETTPMTAALDAVVVTTTLAVPLGGLTRYHIEAKGFIASETAFVRGVPAYVTLAIATLSTVPATMSSLLVPVPTAKDMVMCPEPSELAFEVTVLSRAIPDPCMASAMIPQFPTPAPPFILTARLVWAEMTVS